MRRVKVVQNPAAMVAALEVQTAPVRRAFAEAALVRARVLAAEHRDTGAFEASLVVEGTRLGTTDDGGDDIEFGTEDTPPRAVLRRAAGQVGAIVSGGEARP